MSDSARGSAMTRVAHALLGPLDASALDGRIARSRSTGRKGNLHGPGPSADQPAHLQAPRSGTKGWGLPPSQIFDLGHMRGEVYAAPMSDGRWQAHVSLVRVDTCRRIDRFALDGSYATLEDLTVAARMAAQARASQPLVATGGVLCTPTT